VNAISVVFLMVASIAILALPLRFVTLPLLAGACYMTLGQGVEIAGLSFPMIRLLIAVGFIRIILRREKRTGRFNSLDKLMVAWAAWAVFSSLFHGDPSQAFVNRLGLVYNACGVYFLVRVFCRSIDDAVLVCQFVAALLIPLSISMLVEQITGTNMFSIFGGVAEISEVRRGITRAQGPFAHSILAGSVGAACLPLMAALWLKQRAVAVVGAAACLLIVLTSASSGPLMSTAFAVLALSFWKMREYLSVVRWSAVFMYLALALVMNAPAYYILARIDLTGSSTSWHRAELINAAINHFSEWWLIGTDYTRHWMPYGVSWSGNHVDITNYYINMGVYGGLALLLLFIAGFWSGFSFVGKCIPRLEKVPRGRRSRVPEQTRVTQSDAIVMWSLGSSLFVHAATVLAVSYFDQSVIFLYTTLALIAASYEYLRVAEGEAAPFRRLRTEQKVRWATARHPTSPERRMR